MAARKILAIIIALAMILGMPVCLSGCQRTEEFELTDNEKGGLVAISRQSNFIYGYEFDQYILYDPETLVMYVMISGGKGTSMSMLYNADGTPKLYNPNK